MYVCMYVCMCTMKTLNLCMYVLYVQAITSAKNNKPVEKDRKKDDKRERGNLPNPYYYVKFEI